MWVRYVVFADLEPTDADASQIRVVRSADPQYGHRPGYGGGGYRPGGGGGYRPGYGGGGGGYRPGGFGGGGFGGSASNANAASQSFNGGFGGFGGSASQASASSSSFG